MKKIVRVVVMLLVIFLCLNLTAFAAAPNDTEEVTPNSDFIRVCNQLFMGNGEVYDDNGGDITGSFVERYYGAFQNGDYATILSACFDEGISRIHGRESRVEQNGARAVLYPTYEESVVHLVEQEGAPHDGKNWYMIVTVSGSYTYQDSYGGYIVDFPNPTISVTFSGLGALFSGSLDSVRHTTPVINGRTASFSVTTTHTVECPTLIEHITQTLGPFTHVSNFTIEGI